MVGDAGHFKAFQFCLLPHLPRHLQNRLCFNQVFEFAMVYEHQNMLKIQSSLSGVGS
jgi:hypothetical protein